jgi:SnoaL-like domain
MTTTDTNTAFDTTAIDSYVAAWNEPDDDRRAALLESALAADLWYRDPMLEADSRDAFNAVLAGVQQQLPGHVLTRTSDVDAHHDLVRFNWALGIPGQSPTFTGVDIVMFDGDGKLHRIVGFAPETIG